MFSDSWMDDILGEEEDSHPVVLDVMLSMTLEEAAIMREAKRAEEVRIIEERMNALGVAEQMRKEQEKMDWDSGLEQGASTSSSSSSIASESKRILDESDPSVEVDIPEYLEDVDMDSEDDVSEYEEDIETWRKPRGGKIGLDMHISPESVDQYDADMTLSDEFSDSEDDEEDVETWREPRGGKFGLDMHISPEPVDQYDVESSDGDDEDSEESEDEVEEEDSDDDDVDFTQNRVLHWVNINSPIGCEESEESESASDHDSDDELDEANVTTQRPLRGGKIRWNKPESDYSTSDDDY